MYAKYAVSGVHHEMPIDLIGAHIGLAASRHIIVILVLDELTKTSSAWFGLPSPKRLNLTSLVVGTLSFMSPLKYVR